MVMALAGVRPCNAMVASDVAVPRAMTLTACG
jgi:hypothetical protein